jgi:hypothetical protein
MKIAIVVAATLVASGCNRGLTNGDAQQAIVAHPLIEAADNVKVEAISQESGKTEAIVRASIGDARLNLKLRRYDKGWTWEAVETKAGGWIAPDEAIKQIRDQQRQARALQWAAEHGAKYSDSVKAVLVYVDSLPSGSKIGLQEGWFLMREFSVKGAKIGNFSENERQERIKKFSEPAIDAWGNEVLMSFSESDRTATFVSAGLDKKKGTEDDIVCVAVGQQVWSPADERLVWRYRKTWRVPEGLETVIKPLLEAEDQMEFARLAQR